MLVTIAAAAAALFHVVFFLLESVLWKKPAVRKSFGSRADDPPIVALLAFNQGFYNLFLAAIVVAGLILGPDPVGNALVLASCATMVGAAVVLALSAKELWRAALVQGTPPAIAIILILLG